jgi:hypothetical protein
MINQVISADYLGTKETRTLSPRSDVGDTASVSTNPSGLNSPVPFIGVFYRQN